MSGGIGAKKVDITWATEESGLLLAISVKCITARDVATRNYQKNLINRRGDMLGEAVTLHRRFPYAVLGGFLFLDSGAAHDASDQRSSTFRNAHGAFVATLPVEMSSTNVSTSHWSTSPAPSRQLRSRTPANQTAR
ncbi:MAG TPA: hypothetical protein VEO54_11970 [Thermoanaerobaculia bacterium]|nr:hypothetical protein [Thermoanaerobaculia bacterium]